MSVGRNRSRRRGMSVGRPRRRSTTIKLQDKATRLGREYSVYTNSQTPEHERVIFAKDPEFLRAPVGTSFSAQYLGRSYRGKKSLRIVRRGNLSISVPVLEFLVTSGK
jgi:hypothetical protein